jgi:hypothetical protein
MVKPVSLFSVPFFLRIFEPTIDERGDFMNRNKGWGFDRTHELVREYLDSRGTFIMDPYCLDPKTRDDFGDIFGRGIGMEKISDKKARQGGLWTNGKLYGELTGRVVLPSDPKQLQDLLDEEELLVQLEGAKGLAILKDDETPEVYIKKMPSNLPWSKTYALHGLRTYSGSCQIEFRDAHENMVKGKFSRYANVSG